VSPSVEVFKLLGFRSAFRFAYTQVSGDAKDVACNNGAGGYTERHFNIQTYLTEPQGKLKEWKTSKNAT
jgi:hypothetical protein